MFEPLHFEPPVEDLVRFMETTEPDDIVRATVAKLRAGVSPKELITAGVLAVARSTELPGNHHGGPVHPVCGVRGAYHIAQRLSGEAAYLPVIQHAALCNHHIHSRQMGPYIMPRLEPLPGRAEAVDAESLETFYGSLEDVPIRAARADETSVTKQSFLTALALNKPVVAEQHLLWLLERVPFGEVLDLMLPRAIARNTLDDHFVLFPLFTCQALDCIGWEWAPVLMRLVVRYQARNVNVVGSQRTLDFDTLEGQFAEHGLSDERIEVESCEGETHAIEELAERIASCRDFYDMVGPMAKALVNRLSLAGAGEALSLASATLYLRSDLGSPVDTHLHTGARARRYLLGMEGVSTRNKIFALLTGFTGPECLLSEQRLHWHPAPDRGAQGTRTLLDQDALLDAIAAGIEGLPWVDWAAIGLDDTMAPSQILDALALTHEYVRLGHDPRPLFARLGGLSCRDDFTEMHAMKHLQAIIDEYYATREQFRSVHLLSAVKCVGVVHAGRAHKVYRRAKELAEV